jgi:hypothetical protein
MTWRTFGKAVALALIGQAVVRMALTDAPTNLGAGNQSFQKFIQGPSAVPKRQFSPSRLSETVT